MARRRERLWMALMAACVAGTLVACLAAGILFGSGRAPSFYHSIRLGEQRLLIVRSGAICRSDLPMTACNAGIGDRAFRVIYWTPERSHTLISIRRQPTN
jgi:hypothetical protein